MGRAAAPSASTPRRRHSTGSCGWASIPSSTLVAEAEGHAPQLPGGPAGQASGGKVRERPLRLDEDAVPFQDRRGGAVPGGPGGEGVGVAGSSNGPNGLGAVVIRLAARVREQADGYPQLLLEPCTRGGQVMLLLLDRLVAQDGVVHRVGADGEALADQFLGIAPV